MQFCELKHVWNIQTVEAAKTRLTKFKTVALFDINNEWSSAGLYTNPY